MYAENTGVPTERSKVEIENTLTRYGADAFSYGWQDNRAVICFRLKAMFFRVEIPIPPKPPNEDTWKPNAAGAFRKVTVKQQLRAWEQAQRQRWRAAALIIKAKLEAVEAGISTVEEEFLASTVLPDGSRFGAWAKPQLASVYSSGLMPRKLLPGATDA